VLLVALAGCAGIPEVPPSNGAVDAGPSRAERDRNACIGAAQSALGGDFVVDKRARRVVTRPEGRLLVRYATDDELDFLLDGLVDHLLEACLARRGYQGFPGFLIVPPRGEGWTRDSVKRASSVDIVFTRSAGAADTGHAALVLAGVTEVEMPQLTTDLRNEWNPARFTRVSIDVSPQTWLGADCVRYRIAARDRGVPGLAGEVFTLGVRGIRCLHPDLPGQQPRRVVDLSYSQRFRSGGWQSAIDGEVEPALTSLIWSSVSPTPQILAALRDYVKLLGEVGRSAGAADVVEQMARLQQPSRGIFGIEPAERLRSYAAVLRGYGRQAEAREAEALAAAHLRMNFREYLRQRGR